MPGVFRCVRASSMLIVGSPGLSWALGRLTTPGHKPLSFSSNDFVSKLWSVMAPDACLPALDYARIISASLLLLLLLLLAESFPANRVLRYLIIR